MSVAYFLSVPNIHLDIKGRAFLSNIFVFDFYNLANGSKYITFTTQQ